MEIVMKLNIRDAGLVVASLETTLHMLEKSATLMAEEGATELAAMANAERANIQKIVDDLHNKKSYESDDFDISMIIKDVEDVGRALKLTKEHEQRRDAAKERGEDLKDTVPENIVVFDPNKRDK